MANFREGQNQLNETKKKQIIDKIMAGYREFGYSETMMGKIRADLLRDLQEEAGMDVKGELYGNKEKILANLKHKIEKSTEDAEMEGYKGKKVHINLPVVLEFKGLKFEYFVSDESVPKRDFEQNPELENKSYSMKQIGELLKAIKEYMNAMGVKIDEGIEDYETHLNGDIDYIDYICDAGDCFKEITGVDFRLWLKDKNVAGMEGSRANWDCGFFDFGFFFCFDSSDDSGANLFLRLS